MAESALTEPDLDKLVDIFKEKASVVLSNVAGLEKDHIRVIKEKDAEIARLKEKIEQLKKELMDTTRGECPLCPLKDDIINDFHDFAATFAAIAEKSKNELSLMDSTLTNEDADIIPPTPKKKK